MSMPSMTCRSSAKICVHHAQNSHRAICLTHKPRKSCIGSSHAADPPPRTHHVLFCSAQPTQSVEVTVEDTLYEDIENEVIAEGLASLPVEEVEVLASIDTEAGVLATGEVHGPTDSLDEENPYAEDQTPIMPPGWQGGEPEVEELLREARITRGRGITIERLQRLFPFPLDKFQRRAVQQLLEGKSVVVCAPTGAGKTAIAEAAAAACLAKGLRVIYTTPLKALSNQKLQEVRQRFGQTRAGLQTGDASLNTEADIVVMTTEILRNIMYRTTELVGLESGTREKRLGDVGLVVLDEVHYLGHPDRGSVWEEAIINCPPHIQLLSMSATVRNPDDLGGWISQEQSSCTTIKTMFRPVPLRWHFCYRNQAKGGLVVLDPLLQEGSSRMTINPRITNRSLNLQDARIMMHGYASTSGSSDDEDSWDDPTTRQLEGALKRGGKWGLEKQLTQGRIPEINEVAKLLHEKEMLPAIWFILSRRDCDGSAQRINDLNLTTPAEVDQITYEIEYLRSEQPEAVREAFVPALKRGVASHHAGCLPGWKSLVEKLFQKGLIKIVFATGTLAAGINMPARTTLITALSRKTDDGIQQLPHNELLQMAGRAGRRGYDTLGHCVVLQSRWEGADAAYQIIRKGPEALESQFTASYGLVLNLLSSYSVEEARSFLQRSFGNYMGHEGKQRIIGEVKRLREEAAVLTAAFNTSATAPAKLLTAAVKERRAEMEAVQEQILQQRCDRVRGLLGAPGALPRLVVLNVAKEGGRPVFTSAVAIQPEKVPDFSGTSAKVPPRGPFYRCLLADNRLVRASVQHVVGVGQAPYALQGGQEDIDTLMAAFEKADGNRYAWANYTAGMFSCQVTAGSAATGVVAMRLTDKGSSLQPVEVDEELKRAAGQARTAYKKAVQELETLRRQTKAQAQGEQRQLKKGGSEQLKRTMDKFAKADRLKKRADEMESWLQEEHENMWRRFEDVMDILVAMQAVDAEKHKPLPLGVVARSIQSQNELWMALALTHPAVVGVSGVDLAGLLGALLAPEMSRKTLELGDCFPVSDRVLQILEQMEVKREELFELQLDFGLAKWNELLLVDPRCGGLVQAWASGRSWREIMAGAAMDDGDVARLLMRVIDMLRQISHCDTLLPWLVEPAKQALRGMDRSPVAELVLM